MNLIHFMALQPEKFHLQNYLKLVTEILDQVLAAENQPDQVLKDQKIVKAILIEDLQDLAIDQKAVEKEKEIRIDPKEDQIAALTIVVVDIEIVVALLKKEMIQEISILKKPANQDHFLEFLKAINLKSLKVIFQESASLSLVEKMIMVPGQIIVAADQVDLAAIEEAKADLIPVIAASVILDRSLVEEIIKNLKADLAKDQKMLDRTEDLISLAMIEEDLVNSKENLELKTLKVDIEALDHHPLKVDIIDQALVLVVADLLDQAAVADRVETEPAAQKSGKLI